jgi:thiopurine S-methyltransferase
MESKFWHERWESGQLGFHQESVNETLKSHWHRLSIDTNAPVFVPLCGKSLDMIWLRERGHPVLGIELSPIALEDFFTAADVESDRSSQGALERYAGGGFDLFCGDFFEIESDDLSSVRAVYDRAALIALPPEMRKRYANHLIEVLPSEAQILLITISYDQSKMNGPPHSVTASEIDALFGSAFEIEDLEVGDPVAPGPRFIERGLDLWQERVQRLTRKADGARPR